MKSSFDQINKMSEKKLKFYQLLPNCRKEVMVLDKSFREKLKMFNSKQMRKLKEQLYTSNIVIDKDNPNLELQSDQSAVFVGNHLKLCMQNYFLSRQC